VRNVAAPAIEARRVRVTGIVQGVGFRPFVYRLAGANGLCGWVRNGPSGVEIHLEGAPASIRNAVDALQKDAPAAACVVSVAESSVAIERFDEFVIAPTVESGQRPTVRVSPDLPVCDDCLRELFDPKDRRFRYPYINCTNCGPRYSIVLGLPYDRQRTTMREWPMCDRCATEYHNPADRRFHAQPIACPACGPSYRLQGRGATARGDAAIAAAAALLREGAILAIKGIGGYHLACDARRPDTIAGLRERKYRKERPFALMVRDRETASSTVKLTREAERLLTSAQRPVVLAPSTLEVAGVAPANSDYGIMLPYAPLHHLFFSAGAPSALVMTSANRSSEPIAYRDDDALDRLDGIADAFLIGEREIARRVDDSVAAASACGPIVLRHSRGYAPQVVATLPVHRPMLCVGADLKNAVTLVVGGEAFGSQHIGDLEQHAAFESFKETIRDLCAMYDVALEDAVVVHDAHAQYVSSEYARSFGRQHVAVQHHRAHIASVLAEREAFDAEIIGIAFDGTGYGDDGSIWGGEIFTGSLRGGLVRAISLLPAVLPGGDAAARYPVQAAAGFLSALDDLPDLTAPPFAFPDRYVKALRVARSGVRSFVTTSAGRLFDTVAALVGFTREITFEAQAAMWLEHLARSSRDVPPYVFPLHDGALDFRPVLQAIVADRRRGRDVAEIARAFHAALANALCSAVDALGSQPVAASGGVFQNALLVDMLAERLHTRLWINQRVPANDGGISLGQAGIAAMC
jgi:hydrogenase maturation protein HypF